MFFSIDEKEKIKVLAIGTGAEDYLGRIFTDDEFAFQNVSLDNLNYSLITSQNLIVLNELESIPAALENALRIFVRDGGSLAIIPSANVDVASYNRVLSFLGGGAYGQKLATTLSITGISFSNPLFDQVFEDEVSNFLYPEVREYFRLQTNAPKILSLQGGDPFLAGTNTFYLFSAPLSGESSNFRNSPLIVPTLYNMGVNSLQLPKLYYQIGNSVQVDVPITPAPDRILKVGQQDYEFIPMQRAFANKTTLSFEDSPDRDGNFAITENEVVMKRISFNFDREESELLFMNTDSRLEGRSVDSVAGLFTQLEKEGSITPLWKWFVILAMLFMLAELLIQKFIK